MKAVFINSSPRRTGVTSILLTRMKELIENRYSINWIELIEASVKPCLGCLKCRPNKPCILTYDDGHKIGKEIRESDLIVIGSPCYWGNMPGILKILFDRNVTTFESFTGIVPTPLLSGKKAVLAVASGSPFPFNRLNSQSKGTETSIGTILKAGGIRTAGIMNVPGSRNFEANREKWFKKCADIMNRV